MAPTQLDLFKQPTINNIVRDIKSAMNEAIKKTGLSRDQVRDKMNDLAVRHGIKLNGGNSKHLSQDTFDKWLNIEEENRAPSIKALTVFCAATGSVEPVNVIAVLLGGMVIDANDMKMLTWARAYHKAKDLRREMRSLEVELR